MRVLYRKLTLFLFMVFVLTNFSFAQNPDDFSALDLLRGQMSYMKDKKSPEYIKAEQKLARLISQNRLNYSDEMRFKDAIRLIQEEKYDAAVFELKSLIDLGYNVSKCYELLGDICRYTQKPIKKTVSYYKNALNYNKNDVSVLFKLSQIYISQEKNILGIEFLNGVLDNTDDYAVLSKIEEIISKKVKPKNAHELNNFYETLGLVQMKMGKKDDSFNNLVRAIKANPNDIFLKYYLVDSFYSENCNDEVVRMIDIILQENGNDSQLKTTKAKALAKSGNLNSAYSVYTEILKRNPNSNQAKYGIYKLLKNRISLEEILYKINFSNPNYIVTKEECAKFAKLLEEFGDEQGANGYMILAQKIYENELRKINEQKIKEQQKALKEEAKQKFESKNKEYISLKEVKDSLKAPKTQKPVELKKQVQTKKPVQTQKKTQEQKILEQQKRANEQKQKIEAQKKLQQEKIKKQKEQQELAKKQAEEKRLKELERKKELERQKQIELEKEKFKKAQEEKERLKKLQEEKERQEKIKKEQEQKAYQERKMKQEIFAFSQKNPDKYKQYQAMVDKYLQTETKDAKTYEAVANTYKLMQSPTNSIKYFNEAIKLDPTNSDLYYGLGLAYMELDSFETARYNLEKAIRLEPDNTKVSNLLPFVNQKLVTRCINNAYSKFEENKYLEASEILDEGVKKFPNNAQLFYYRALAYDAMNRNAAAIIDLQKAVSLDPSLHMAYYQLGKSYEKIKDERNALVAYERFLSIEPDEKDLINEIQKKVLALSEKYY